MKKEILRKVKQIFDELDGLSIDSKVETINAIKKELYLKSPFKKEPVDFVQWIKSKDIKANNYNPNKVAPPEMKLLEHSIREDGYTQPIVVWPRNGHYEVIDGFHRNRVGKELIDINSRVHGYLPVTVINKEREAKTDRIASTIRHNRARGKHTVEGMSDIVLELKNRNWSNDRIAKELGMDPDEILRLCQITGLAALFEDQEFSKSWDIEGEVDETYDPLTDEAEAYEEEQEGWRTANTNDPGRVFHTHDKWECYKAGFYATSKNGMTTEQCEIAYKDFLSDTDKFSDSLEKVIVEWKNSCEHYLTNKAFNRIAWLGQAAMCYSTGIPSKYRNGFNLLSKKQQDRANKIALKYLNRWLAANNRMETTMQEAMGNGREVDLY